MQQIPNPGDGFFAPPGGVRYVLTFDELIAAGKSADDAVEQWMLARCGRFDVRSLGVIEELGEGGVREYRARSWGVTMHTPWHVYTITTTPGSGFWKGLEAACRTIDRAMMERGEALSLPPAVPNNSDSSGDPTP